MRINRWLAVVAVLTLGARGAAAQAPARNAGVPDTLPEHVVQRALEAFQRGDVDALYANFDSVFTYLRFGDPAGEHQIRRDENLRHMKGDTAILRIIRGIRTSLVRSDVYGAFVNQEWREVFANGKAFKHFELFEVRGGKIVREIEGDRPESEH